MAAGHRFDPTILREYDIRGVFGETLNAADAYTLGRTFAVIVRQDLAGEGDWTGVAAGAGSDQGRSRLGALQAHNRSDNVANAEHPHAERSENWAENPGAALPNPAAPSQAVSNPAMPSKAARHLIDENADAAYISTAEPGANAPGDGTEASRGEGNSPRRPRIVVGCDGRLSSPILEKALVAGLVEGGIDVVRIGLGPTPMLYFAEASGQDVQGGIQVTGSHNPSDHNGFKIVLRGRPFFGAAIRRLGAMAAVLDGSSVPPEWDDIGPMDAGRSGAAEMIGTIHERDVRDAYVERLLEGLAGIEPGRLDGLKMAWDAGNGAAGPVLESLVGRLPGEHHLLFSDVDGRFPNHHPDPTIDANLSDLRAAVAAKNLHFGVAFDGDADRIGVVDRFGRAIPSDQLLAIYAQDVLARFPKSTVISDVKASRAVFERISALGGTPIMAPSGHSYIKARMKETGALLGGETSGHLFFADDYYGYDDGIYAAIRLIAAILRLDASVESLFDALPKTVATPELRFAAPDAGKFAIVEAVRRRLEAEDADVVALDGVRVTTPDGWWLLRASNTEAALTARAESETPQGVERLVAAIDRQLALSGLSRGDLGTS